MAEKKKLGKVKKAPAKRKLFSKAKGRNKEAAKVSDFGILRKPVVTEKSSLVSGNSASGPGTAIVLKVDPRATKIEIKEAVERIYKVDVVSVNTVNYAGKIKRAKRASGRQDKFKKAYITVKEGQSINVVEGL